jgi:hypothetical protein
MVCILANQVLLRFSYKTQRQPKFNSLISTATYSP